MARMPLDSNVGIKYSGIVQTRKGGTPQKLMGRCRMRGCHEGNTAVGSHQNGVCVLRISDFVANYNLRSHAPYCDLDADRARVSNQYVEELCLSCKNRK